ncbi:MAG: hypothetical protein D6753_07800, partial [Planctomycetota bacterium]
QQEEGLPRAKTVQTFGSTKSIRPPRPRLNPNLGQAATEPFAVRWIIIRIGADQPTAIFSSGRKGCDSTKMGYHGTAADGSWSRQVCVFACQNRIENSRQDTGHLDDSG